MKQENPGNLPRAASALIISPSGLVLAVSRKHDPNDLGLPGGKLDPGEDAQTAIIREVKEETGFDVIKLRSIPFFADACGTPGIHHVHWCETFLCKVQGTLGTTEKGRVVWIPPWRLIRNEAGNYNSFGTYNRDMLERFEALRMNVPEFHSNVEIKESQVLRFSWDDARLGP